MPPGGTCAQHVRHDDRRIARLEVRIVASAADGDAESVAEHAVDDHGQVLPRRALVALQTKRRVSSSKERRAIETREHGISPRESVKHVRNPGSYQ